jgi:hypothetical protein
LADFRFLAPLALLLGLLSFSPVATASHIECGDVITQNTKLDSDVVCTGSPYDGQPIFGLVVGANDVTLNLGGHTVQGPDNGLARDVTGIVDDGTPREGLRIVNGTVTNFSQGIDLDTSGSVLRGITIPVETPFGIRLRGNDSLVSDNIARTGYTAISMAGDGNRATHNDIRSFEGEGIVARGSNVRIAHNLIRDEEMGLYPGIQVSGFTNAVVTGNDVSSAWAPAIELRNGTGALVARNFAHDSGQNGIVIGSDASNVGLRRNTANANGTWVEGTGIQVDSPSVTITGNTANDNGWYGIKAVPGVVDGGGNRASGNGNPAQCVGVRCK